PALWRWLRRSCQTSSPVCRDSVQPGAKRATAERSRNRDRNFPKPKSYSSYKKESRSANPIKPCSLRAWWNAGTTFAVGMRRHPCYQWYTASRKHEDEHENELRLNHFFRMCGWRFVFCLRRYPSVSWPCSCSHWASAARPLNSQSSTPLYYAGSRLL